MPESEEISFPLERAQEDQKNHGNRLAGHESRRNVPGWAAAENSCRKQRNALNNSATVRRTEIPPCILPRRISPRLDHLGIPPFAASGPRQAPPTPRQSAGFLNSEIETVDPNPRRAAANFRDTRNSQVFALPWLIRFPRTSFRSTSCSASPVHRACPD